MQDIFSAVINTIETKNISSTTLDINWKIEVSKLCQHHPHNIIICLFYDNIFHITYDTKYANRLSNVPTKSNQNAHILDAFYASQISILFAIDCNNLYTNQVLSVFFLHGCLRGRMSFGTAPVN